MGGCGVLPLLVCHVGPRRVRVTADVRVERPERSVVCLLQGRFSADDIFLILDRARYKADPQERGCACGAAQLSIFGPLKPSSMPRCGFGVARTGIPAFPCRALGAACKKRSRGSI